MTFSYDPLSPETLADPFPTYRALRDESPVCTLRDGELYAVARYDDVARVLRQDETFSSAVMREVFLDTEAVIRGDRAGLAQLGAALDSAMPGMTALFEKRNLIADDGERHHSLRALVNRGFTPSRIGALEKTAREITAACLDEARGAGEFDLISQLAAPLPCTMIAQLLGVEPERHADFRRWSNAVIDAVTGAMNRAQRDQALGPFLEMVTHLNEIIAQRRTEPREDLISTVVRAEQGEVALDPTEVLIFAFGLLIAGNETTTNLIGNAVLALLAHPEQLAIAARDPACAPDLVEEALRYEGPIQTLFRRVTRDTTLQGVRLPAGATVLALIGSANRDDRRFPAPDRFDIERREKGHLAFGLGAHFCLGAALARLEARVALEALIQLPGLSRIDDAPLERTASVFMRGPRSLPLRIEGSH